jgi:hypothetical protein
MSHLEIYRNRALHFNGSLDHSVHNCLGLLALGIIV